MEKRLIFIFLFNLLIFCSIFLLGLAYISKELLLYSRTEFDRTDTIFNTRSLQTTVDISANVNLIEVRLKNLGLVNHDNFSLQIKQNNILLRQLNINGNNFGDDEWVKFKFIPDVKFSGQTDIQLSSETTNSIPIQAFKNNKGEINLKIFGKTSINDTFSKAFNNFYEKFISDQGFISIYFLLLFLMFGSYLYLSLPVHKRYD